ncbi:MAG: rod shape-determining protein MreC [Helicobacteraceae bacterium]|jgi:rod shape-determining protein MreC|nr:rod shape-determining protein MreC [Helicobacteraceae bacterium]
MLKPVLFAAAVILLSVLAVRFQIAGGTPFVEVTTAIKSQYLTWTREIDEWKETYFNQAETIERLRTENEALKADREVLNAFAAELIDLSKLKDYETPPNFRVRAVRAVSYAELPDMQKIIVDYSDLKQGEVKGLIYNNNAAGIVVAPIGRYARALLNGDAECSYSVYIGSDRAPGIVMGKSDQEMIARYIPAWMNVKVGDEAITNGLDGIFFAGVKVGVVTKVNRLNAYIEATISPYYSSFNPDYFYIVESFD